jgi:MFS family permease
MRLPRSAALYLQASIILFFLAGSSAPTPLYPLYQAAWGFSPVTVTIVFGIYALTVLATLLVAGSLSDYVGRRPVLMAATLMQAGSLAVFATAGGLGELLVARVVQGVATGMAAGAVGAGMLDIDKERGTVANAVAPMLGTATGGLLSGLLVQFLPLPTQLVYIVLGVIFLAQSIGVAAMQETVSRRPGALSSLKPHVRLPPHARRAALVAVPALVAIWSLAGFYGSLGPALVRRLLGSNALFLGGLPISVLAAFAALSVFLVHSRPPRLVMAQGTAMLVVGVGTTLLATTNGSAGVFFLGTAIAGAGFGAAFQGAIRSVLLLAAPHERAGVLSMLYVVAYLALGLPAVLAGLRFAHGVGVIETAREYGAGVIVLAAMAFVGVLVSGSARRERGTGRLSVSRPA